MDFKEFHQQSQKYALSRVKDKIQETSIENNYIY